MTVAELLSRISSRELTEWIALYELEAQERAEAEDKGKTWRPPG